RTNINIIPTTCQIPKGRFNHIKLLSTAVKGSTVPNNVVSFASRYSKLLINIQNAKVVPNIIVKHSTRMMDIDQSCVSTSHIGCTTFIHNPAISIAHPTTVTDE